MNIKRLKRALFWLEIGRDGENIDRQDLERVSVAIAGAFEEGEALERSFIRVMEDYCREKYIVFNYEAGGGGC